MALENLEIVWETHKNLKIRDIHFKTYERIKNYMLENYFKPHEFFDLLDWQEQEDINDNYLAYVQHIIIDDCSIVVLDEETNEIWGVALVKCMTKEWWSWVGISLVNEKGKLAELTTLRRRMFVNYHKTNPDAVFDSLHLFEYYIRDELIDDLEFMRKFFFSICEVARHMKMPRVTFLALSSSEQREAVYQDFVELTRIIYSIYKVGGKRPFAALRDIDENYTVLYEKMVEPLRPYNMTESEENLLNQEQNFLKAKSTMTLASTVEKM